MLNRSCPLKSSRFPWVLRSSLTCKYAEEEVPKEYNLECSTYNSKYSNDYINICKVVKQRESRVSIVTPWKACHTYKVHWEKYTISTYCRYPEVDETKIFVKHPSKHLREPVVNTRKHTIKGRDTHYKVEVGYYEISIVNINIKRTVSKDNTCKTTCNKRRNKSY